MATVAYAAKRLKLRTQRDRTARADTSPGVFSDRSFSKGRYGFALVHALCPMSARRLLAGQVTKNGGHAAARSSLSAPRATIFRAPSGNGRCKALASSHGARIQTSHSSSVVRMTGIAFGWIGSTIAFGAVVRKP